MRSIVIACLACLPLASQDTRQATGVRVGEVTEDSAIVWMRVTARAARNPDGLVQRGAGALRLPEGVKVEQLEGACPGAPGRVRLRYGAREDLRDARATAWAEVSAAADYTHQFRLTGLKPATAYYYAAETATPGGKPVHAPLRGRFQTAPPASQYAEVTFTVVTGHMYKDLDHPEGFHIYAAMLKLAPHFIVPTGDNVYYDNEAPRATTPEVARYHWHRMFSYPRHVAFYLQAPAYWEKDDHDTLFDDCWPAMRPQQMLPLTFEDGQRIFLEQVPMREKTYRSYRWGKGLQVWLTEGRDFRSANRAPDGPAKTIWGAAQKKWLYETILASDADFKVLVSPTPIVGPDRANKGDNHANAAFAHEGNEFRRWVQKNVPGNFFIACGDRHWQYHSVHPETGVEEFCAGPASDQHAAGTPGYDPRYHRFHLVKGGFLSVSFRRTGAQSQLLFRHHDVRGKVVYQYERSR
jgi:alkaline phosphatase D